MHLHVTRTVVMLNGVEEGLGEIGRGNYSWVSCDDWIELRNVLLRIDRLLRTCRLLGTTVIFPCDLHCVIGQSAHFVKILVKCLC